MFAGVNIHPAIAKDKMKNTMRAAGHFLVKMPTDMSPENTDGRDGFLHPYGIGGGVASVSLRVLLRDFDTAKLSEYAKLLQGLTTSVQQENPVIQVDVQLREQYRNMVDVLVTEPLQPPWLWQPMKILGERRIRPSLAEERMALD